MAFLGVATTAIRKRKTIANARFRGPEMMEQSSNVSRMTTAAAYTANTMTDRKKVKYVRLPLPVLKFLLGMAPLEGVWFGEKHPKRKGNFWWRSAYLGKHYKRVNAVRAEDLP